jgi:hypothetical protein
MRTAITIGIRHGGKPTEVVSLPDVPIITQRSAFKLLRQEATNPLYERVELWDSGGGRMRTARFGKPAEIPSAPPLRPSQQDQEQARPAYRRAEQTGQRNR